MEATRAMPNELNELVNSGKENIRVYVQRYLQRFMTSGSEEEKRLAETVSSLLTLSLKKSAVDIDVQRVRSLIIEENMDVLSSMVDGDTHMVRLFAISTGRVTQAREYLSAIDRIGQTCQDDAIAMSRYLSGLQGAILTVERAGVRMFYNERGRLGLPDLGKGGADVGETRELG